MTTDNGLKIRWRKLREGSSSSARTSCLLLWRLTDEGQERTASNAHGKVIAASLRAAPLPSGGVGRVSDRQ